MLGGHFPEATRIELDRDMLETMKGLFDTHADDEGNLRLRFGGDVVTVENARTGECRTLGTTKLPDYLRSRIR